MNNDRAGALQVYHARAWIEYDRSDVERLEPTLEAIRPVVERSGDADLLSQYYFLAPMIDFRRYGYQMTDKILNYFKLAMDTSRNGSDLEVRTRGIFGYAFGQYMIDQCDEAIPYFHEALKLAEQIGYVEQQMLNLTYLAGAPRRAEHLEDCRVISERSLELCQREGYKSYVSTALANLGWIAWKRNDLKRAKALSLQALSGWSQHYPFCWLGLWTLMDLSLLALRTDEAVGYARRLKAPGQQIFVKECDDLLTKAIQFAEQGESAKAESLLKKAVDWAKQSHYL